jgi:hypothetical protein
MAGGVNFSHWLLDILMNASKSDLGERKKRIHSGLANLQILYACDRLRSHLKPPICMSSSVP